MITVVYGSNAPEVPGFEGATVATVRASFAPAGVSADAAALLNGAPASESDVLRAGDELAFVKTTAQKG